MEFFVAECFSQLVGMLSPVVLFMTFHYNIVKINKQFGWFVFNRDVVSSESNTGFLQVFYS